MPSHLFIFGLGYTGTRLAKAALARGYQVSGTVRSSEKAVEWQQRGVYAIPYDSAAEGDAKEESKLRLKKALEDCDYIICTAAPLPIIGDPLLEGAGDELIARKDHIKWVGYLSTTGVYGNRDGALVDETTPVAPGSKRGELRVTAEKAWAATGLPVHIFRLPGIYGPTRGPLNKIREGDARRIRKPNHCFNRIHVDDIVGAVLASMDRPSSECGRVYNVVDDLPAPQEDVVEYGCKLLAVQPPPLVEYEEASKQMSAMALSFWAESRRVISVRLKSELGYFLTYPTYKEGLKAQWEEEEHMKGGQALTSNTTRAFGFGVKGLFPITSFVLNVWNFLWNPNDLTENGPICILLDNGSVRAASTLCLRRVASDVQQRIGVHVLPVSCRFSNRVKPEELGGTTANTLLPTLERVIDAGYTDIIVLPFFFGRSSAVTEYLPQCWQRVVDARSQRRVQLHVADSLVDLSGRDTRIAQILVSFVEETILAQTLCEPAVVVCDHGTPIREVHTCREVVTNQVQSMLHGKVKTVVSASMERRDGPAYDFNDPLLENVFEQEKIDNGAAVIAMMFLSPGKHAGEGGDVATILQNAEAKHQGLKTYMTRLMNSHPLIIDILVDRYKAIST